MCGVVMLRVRGVAATGACARIVGSSRINTLRRYCVEEKACKPATDTCSGNGFKVPAGDSALCGAVALCDVYVGAVGKTLPAVSAPLLIHMLPATLPSVRALGIPRVGTLPPRVWLRAAIVGGSMTYPCATAGGVTAPASQAGPSKVVTARTTCRAPNMTFAATARVPPARVAGESAA